MKRHKNARTSPDDAAGTRVGLERGPVGRRRRRGACARSANGSPDTATKGRPGLLDRWSRPRNLPLRIAEGW